MPLFNVSPALEVEYLLWVALQQRHSPFVQVREGVVVDLVEVWILRVVRPPLVVEILEVDQIGRLVGKQGAIDPAVAEVYDHAATAVRVHQYLGVVQLLRDLVSAVGEGEVRQLRLVRLRTVVAEGHVAVEGHVAAQQVCLPELRPGQGGSHGHVLVRIEVEDADVLLPVLQNTLVLVDDLIMAVHVGQGEARRMAALEDEGQPAPLGELEQMGILQVEVQVFRLNHYFVFSNVQRAAVIDKMMGHAAGKQWTLLDRRRVVVGVSVDHVHGLCWLRARLHTE